jgi:hypothetical protein
MEGLCWTWSVGWKNACLCVQTDVSNFGPRAPRRLVATMNTNSKSVARSNDQRKARPKSTMKTSTLCRTEKGVYFPKYANRGGAKSAKRVPNGLLSLLALPHIGISRTQICLGHMLV